MDVEKLKKIRKIMENAKIDELHLQNENINLRLKSDEKKGSQSKPKSPAKKEIKKSGMANSLAKESVNQEDAGIANEETFDIVSPEIGYFSRFSSKTKKQYVKLRDVVKEGDVVAHIVFNAYRT